MKNTFFKETKKPSWKMPCQSPQHNPPSMIVIPPGQTLVHICPSCGYKFEIQSSNITL